MPHRGSVRPDWRDLPVLVVVLVAFGAGFWRAFERPAPACDQRVARIALARRVAAARGLHRAARNLDLGVFRSTRQFLDRLPVAVTRREVHLSEAGVRTQDRIDEADALEQVRPVDG